MRKNNKRLSKRRKKIRKKSKSPIPQPVGFSSHSEHLFFSMLGANYLISDYENGEWTPIFDLKNNPSIELKDQTEVIARFAYSEDSENQYNEKYIIPGSWVLLPSEIKKPIYDQLLLEMGKDSLTEELNPKVWEFFHNFKGVLVGMLSVL